MAAARIAMPGCLLLMLHSLNDGCYSLPNADTHGRQAIMPAAPFQFMKQCDDQPCPAAAQRMPQGDGSTIDVDFFFVHFQFAHTLQTLDGEALVQFYQVNVLDPQPAPFQ